jgi:uncharacterized protein (DUF1501 family)
MFVLGGPVKGGRMYGRWSGLQQEHLYQGRDLAVTTDFRRVLSEAVANHLGNRALAKVFPGFDKNRPKDFLKHLGWFRLIYISHRAAVFAALFLCPK